jgi:hypothetical protein
MSWFSNIFSSEPTNEKDFMEVTGKYVFHLEPKINGILPYSTSTIEIVAYDVEEEESRRMIPINCKWFRLIEGRAYEVEGKEDAVYHLSPLDIGAKVQAVVSSVNMGKATIVFGPVKMDVSHRDVIGENVFSNFGEYRVRIPAIDGRATNDLPRFENKLILSKSEIFIFFSTALSGHESELRYNFDGHLGFTMKEDGADPRVVVLAFDYEDCERVFHFQFEYRNMRDCFIETLRVMRCLKCLNIADMVNNFGKVLSREWLPVLITQNAGAIYRANFNSDLELIKMALKDIIGINKLLSRDNDKLHDLIQILENDLNFAMKEFRALLENYKKKGDVDLKPFESVERSMRGESSVLLDSLRKDINSSITLKKNEREVNVHGKRLLENERVAKLERDIDSSQKLNQMLRTEISKLKPEEHWHAKPTEPKAFNPFLDESGEGDEFRPRDSFLQEQGHNEHSLGLAKNYAIAEPVSFAKKAQPTHHEKHDSKLNTDEMRKLTKTMFNCETETILNVTTAGVEFQLKYHKELSDLSKSHEELLGKSDEELESMAGRLFERHQELVQSKIEVVHDAGEAEIYRAELISLKVLHMLQKELFSVDTFSGAHRGLADQLMEMARKALGGREGGAKAEESRGSRKEELLKALAEESEKLEGMQAVGLAAQKEENGKLRKQLEEMKGQRRGWDEKAAKVKELEEELKGLKDRRGKGLEEVQGITNQHLMGELEDKGL